MSDETARLERMIGDLLDLARLEGGGGTLQVETVPVGGAVRAASSRGTSGRPRPLASRIEWRSSPAPRRSLAIALAWSRRSRTLLPTRFGTRRRDAALTLRSRNDDSSVALLVSDDGPGIRAEHLPRVFDRFYKVDESRVAQLGAGGSGLGLSIVKAIVERHGAQISVTSEPGRTCFAITGLPKDTGAHEE